MLVAKMRPRRSRIRPRDASSAEVDVLEPIAGINFDGGTVFSCAVRARVATSAAMVSTTTPRDQPRIRVDGFILPTPRESSGRLRLPVILSATLRCDTVSRANADQVDAQPFESPPDAFDERFPHATTTEFFLVRAFANASARCHAQVHTAVDAALIRHKRVSQFR